MMIFLIQYDRQSGRLVSTRTFEESERQKAEDSRLELELDLNQNGKEHEVVILEAISEEVLRRTHRRYFEELADLVKIP